MRTVPELALADLLQGMQVKCSGAYVSNLVKKHPDYPALSCITDTLDHLHIDNAAALLTAEEVKDIPFPFLAHLNTAGGSFVVMRDARQFDDFFFGQWSGVIVVAETPAGWDHPGNTRALAKEKKDRYRFIAATVLLAGLLLAGLLLNPVSAGWWLSLIAAAGLFVSSLIVMQDIGIDNGLAQQICGNGQDCKSVIQWKNKRGFGWSDMAMGWFAFLYLSLLVSVFTATLQKELAWIALFSMAGLLIIPVSVYYQWRVIKRWCRLCLLTAALLLLQFLVVFPSLSFDPGSLKLSDAVQQVAWLILVMMAWLPVKKLLRQNRKLSKDLLELERIKSNPQVFMNFLQQQQQVDAVPWEQELQLASAKAPLQMVVACGAYCAPCAKAHEVLHHIAERFGDKVGISVRFNGDLSDPSDARTQVLRHTLQYIAEKGAGSNDAERSALTRKVLQQWFSIMNLDTFKAEFPVHHPRNVDAVIVKQQQWFIRNSIAGTPSLFINGHALPSSYTIRELPALLEKLTEEITPHSISPAFQPA